MLRRGFVFLTLVVSWAFVSCEQPVTDGGPVNAQPPSIAGQPQGGTWDVIKADTFPLTVAATSPDSGTLSYQWYSNSSASNSGGTTVTGATNATLTLAKVNHTGDGPRYFYVVVTNTINDNGDGGNKTASVTGNAVTVTVTGNGVTAVNAQPPSITTQSQGGTWNVSTADTFSLTVTAASPDSGTLGYQWYSNASDSNSGGTALSGATNAALTLAKANYTGDGPRYFYVVVTNTISDNGDGGNKTASVTGNAVTVTVTGNGVDAVNAQQPVIATQPQGGTWDVSTADTFSLTVTATSPDSGTLGYQWYSNANDSNSGGTVVSGAANATLTLAKAHYTTNGVYYFYVVVTNTINDNGDGGQKTVSVTGNALTVTVTGNTGGITVNAQQPVIATQPQGSTWNVFAADTLSLTVGASVTDGGTLSYQWYSTIGPAIISYNNPVTTGGTSATLSLNYENYTSDGARSYFFVEVKNTNTNVNGTQTATAISSIATVAITGNAEFIYEETALPQDLIGQWIAYETVTISATEFSSQMQGYGGYRGTIEGHRSNGDAGYIIIQYTQNDWDTGAVGKFYVIHYKELTSATMKYSGAYSTSDPGFSGGGGGGKATQEEAKKTYTVTGGYFDGDSAYTLVAKNP